MRPILPAFLSLLLGTAALAGGHPAALPGSRPEGFLPDVGSYWVATERDEFETLVLAGARPLPKLGLALRRGWLTESVVDISWLGLAETRDRPSLLLASHGLGSIGAERADAVMLGKTLGPIRLSGGLAWSGDRGWFQGRMSPLLVGRWTPEGGAWSAVLEGGRFGPVSQPRAMLTYRPLSWIEMSGGYQPGRGIITGLTLRADADGLPVPEPRPARARVAGPGRVVLGVPDRTDLARLVGRAALGTPPSRQGTVTVETHAQGLPGVRVEMLGADLERAKRLRGSPAEIARNARFSQADGPDALGTELDLTLDTRFELGPGPGDAGWVYRWTAGLEAALRPLPGIQLSLAGRVGLDDTALLLPPPGPRPVRGDLDAYAARVAGLERASLAAYARLGDGLTALLDAGYLEEMFAGAGGELEYRPFRSTWRLGLRVHQAWKREPGFGLRQDTGVTTGAVGIRQDIGDPDTVLSLAGERFLDGGWGPVAALEMRLPGGGLLEAEALLADGLAVGLGLRVPLGRFLGPVEATMAAKTKPLARDTGQRLERPLRLADLTDRIGYGRLAAGWEGLLGDPVTCAARWCRSPGPGRR